MNKPGLPSTHAEPGGPPATERSDAPEQGARRTAAAERLADANSCVMCGLCLPHCPTYGLERNEADGPRGRIALMLALNQGRLPVDDHVAGHLDACLGCRACEQMCPSGVPYGRLIDGARQELRASGKANESAARWRDRVLTHRARLSVLVGAQALSDRIGLGKLTRALAGPAADALPRPLPWPTDPIGIHPATTAYRGRVGLFIGCMGTSLDADTTRAALKVLTRLGWTVVVPRAQGCCGAMHRHDGAVDRADALIARNVEAFRAMDVERVIGTSTACVAEWREQAIGAPPVEELTDFLARVPEAAWPELVPARGRKVAVHLPCSQRNVLRDPDAGERLLRRIPQLEVATLPGNALCCGSAGLRRLTHPEQARALRAPKLDTIEALDPDDLVSTNAGCILHLNVGLGQRGSRLRVQHPVQLIARHLSGD
ncbi:MAG: (Fe-S)-binding protein [Halothiobacillaceae bacterium]